MSNKGYYSWIHTLKSAAMDARQKGIEMINEEKAKRASGAAKAKMEAQLNAPPPPPPTRKLDVAGKGYGGRDEEIIDVPGLGRYPKSRVEGEMAIEINRAMDAGEPDFEKPSVHGVDMASGDPGAFARLTRMKRAEVRAQVAQARGPVDAKPAGNANAVVRDGSDNVMADPEDGNEFITRLPKFSLAALARAEAGNAQPGDVELAKNAEPPLMSPEDELKWHQDEREAAWEAEEEDRLLKDYSGRTGEVRMESKYVNQLITNLLNEEDEDSIRKQTDTEPIRGGKPGTGTENIFSTDKLNFKQLVDIYKNPHKYPPHFVAGVRAAFQDVFGID
jgi:hypothetical protein